MSAYCGTPGCSWCADPSNRGEDLVERLAELRQAVKTGAISVSEYARLVNRDIHTIASSPVSITNSGGELKPALRQARRRDGR